MQVEDLAAQFNLTVVAGKDVLGRTVTGGHCGDLLSEVMANAPTGSVWLTIQVHQNIVAVAVLKEMTAIILTGGNVPDEATRVKADAEGIPIMLSDERTYDLAGKLYEAGVV
ncbi:MAG: serine kinase [Desulfobacteraceae bacterium]|nr:serine kinase [Desulfobacteraceae bacterium]MBC2753977.1 serine kinase [Desulfobacteraceae bacterium]